jgi:hypothetical protein
VASEAEASDDADLALNLLMGAALRCWWADTGPAARDEVVHASRRLGHRDADARWLAAVAVAQPLEQCAEVSRRLARLDLGGITDGDSLRLLGMAAHAIGDEPAAADLLGRATTELRVDGQLGLLPQVLSMAVQVRLEVGDWSGAAAAAAEGRQLAADTGQPIWATGTLVCEARLQALRGDVREAFRMAAEAEMTARPRRVNTALACVQIVRGTALLRQGASQEAYQVLRPLFDPGDACFHQRERFAGIMVYVDAAKQSGHYEQARAVLNQLEETAGHVPSPILLAHLAYARIVLLDRRQDERCPTPEFWQLLTRWPWIKARTQLAYATWLGQRGRDHEAVPILETATAKLHEIGASHWVEVPHHRRPQRSTGGHVV